jgi:hypothetical protein
MNITSAKYYTHPSSEENQGIEMVSDDGTGRITMHVPLDTDNRHYAAILEWAEEDGNEIQAAE